MIDFTKKKEKNPLQTKWRQKARETRHKIWASAKKLKEDFLKSNKEVIPTTTRFAQDLVKARDAIKLFAKSSWGKRSAKIGLALTGMYFVKKMVQATVPQQRIPEEYEKGFKILNENMTDFGSPVKLAKAAQKVITPYYSTVRKAAFTTTRSVIESNPAFALAKHAIGHGKY